MTGSRSDLEWSRWETWASSRSYSPLPADTAHVAEYAMGLLVLGASTASVAMVLSSIRWCHREADAVSPPQDDRIPVTLQAAAVAADPLTADDAAELVAASGGRRSYRVGKGVRYEKESRTRKRAVLDSVIVGLGWETLATATEIADLAWSDVEFDRRMVRYQERGGWSPISDSLAHRLRQLAEMQDSSGVVDLSSVSVRRRVREAAQHGDLGPGWSLRRLRTSAIQAIASRGASMADFTVAGLSASTISERAWRGPLKSGRALAAHVADTPIPPPE